MSRRRAYLLLETTIATGLLIAGLAVIGAQVQQADTSLREMELRVRALMLAEMKLAELDLGLVELDSVDPVQEEDFGPRFPDFGWRLITEETAIDELFEMQFEVLYFLREGEYEPDDFDHENAQVLHTVYALRALPQKVDLGVEMGLSEEDVEALREKLDTLAIPGISVDDFDPTVLPLLPFEDFMEVIPLIADAFDIDLTQILGRLPPNILELLESSGVLGEEGAEEEEGEADEGTGRGSDQDEGS